MLVQIVPSAPSDSNPGASLHLPPGLVLLVLLRPASRALGFDVARSVGEESTADVPLRFLGWGADNPGLTLEQITPG